MACDVASPFADHMLENPETTNLDAIADFNATFGNGDAGINPQMFSSSPTPHNDFCNPFNASGIDQTLSPDPSSYPPTTDFQGPYYQSIETAPAFDVANLRYQTRQRSISEPPDGFALHHRPAPFQPTPQAAVTFHRGGHFLGDPQAQHPKSLKSLPKPKQNSRSSPYKTKSPRQPEHPRYHLRRTQTQPVRPPTSVPGYAMRAQHPMAHMMGPQTVFEPLPLVQGQQQQQQQYVSSRVCTPTPIDPALMASPRSNAFRGEAFMVALTAEQLKGMINEAVQKALRKDEQERQGARGQGSEAVVRDEQFAPDEECIRVAGRSADGDGGEGGEENVPAELFGEGPKDEKIDPFDFDVQ
ncbi:hypothetical protein Tdes44962_MAKER02528 [Teratosphaeria destructans]|uniref:Uncharacterized protein n=1 Tax=Teratosphaeria destructans TaxID=418781 RepID=A0A9W7STB8_9PEZI|nr:hypothetical protein Tdes44962_MAKER02528 [Teratosphaeria destructans]